MKTKLIKTLLLAIILISSIPYVKNVLAGHSGCATIAKYEAVQCPQNDSCEYANMCTMMVDMQEEITQSVNNELSSLGNTVVEVSGKVGSETATNDSGLFQTINDVSEKLGNETDYTEETILGHVNILKGSVGDNLQTKVGFDRAASPDGQDSGMVKVVNEIDVKPKVKNKVTKNQIMNILNKIVTLIRNALN